ncbi:MAG TPA: hypothetical protein VGI45_20360 [Terracidiphilus sp.]|jgi:hypothetical protein
MTVVERPEIHLSISFSGPMFFDFASNLKDGVVDIYVPYCPYHEAGVFFLRHSYSETDLYACALKFKTQDQVERAYRITADGIPPRYSLPTPIKSSYPAGKRSATHNPSSKLDSALKTKTEQDPEHIYILSIDNGSERAKERLPTSVCKRLFKLSVPMPAYLGTLYTDHLQVLPGSGSIEDVAFEHCTALRFYYEWDAESKVYLRAPCHLVRNITPPVYDELPLISDIEIRYEGINLQDGNDPHSDARSCFASLTSLAGTDWWLYYDDGRTSPTGPILPLTQCPPIERDPCDDYEHGGGLHIRTGADCHAPIITTGLSIAP